MIIKYEEKACKNFVLVESMLVQPMFEFEFEYAICKFVGGLDLVTW